MPSDLPPQLLRRVEKTLPSSDYLDPRHHRRELLAIWYRSWLCVGRSQELAQPRDFIVVEVGDQSILVCRDLENRLNAFHNTCRHRGALLCTESSGRLRGGSIICPYHGWTYSLRGDLLGARHQLSQPDFEKRDHPLHAVAVAEWGGFVYLNLRGSAADSLEAALGDIPERFANWQIEKLRVGHRLEKTLECNWKIFWENFSECFHCPGVHPELCEIVPTYGLGVVDASDLPGTSGGGGGVENRDHGTPLAPGAVTWTLDGSSRLPALPGLDESERSHGHSFAVQTPTQFIVAHRDYVRSVRMLPRGPERTELVVEWLFDPEALDRPDFDLAHCVELGRRVVDQDARVCELNQRGLRSMRHDHGVLVAQEYGVYEFQQWVRQALERAEREGTDPNRGG
jgi:Rieske 2Fe-2S family protein